MDYRCEGVACVNVCGAPDEAFERFFGFFVTADAD